MKPTGKHLIAEFISCQENKLNDKNAIETVLKRGIEQSGLYTVSIKSYQYNPIGITTIAIITESHVAIHTYPEAKHVSLDIFTCSPNPLAPTKLLNILRDHFSPQTIRVAEINRGNPLEIKQDDWISSFSTTGLEIKYHIQKKIYSHRSQFQQIDIIQNESFGKMLFLDNELQISESDAHIYNASLLEPVISHSKNLQRVAILGGGDGCVLAEILTRNPKSVVLIDIDPEVVQAAVKHLPEICKTAFHPRSNVQILHTDVFDFFPTNEPFDAIIYDLTMHPEAFIRMDRSVYFSELFRKIRKSLSDNGILSMQCCSDFDTDTKEMVEEILGSLFSNIQFKTSFIPSFCKNWVFVSATL